MYKASSSEVPQRTRFLGDNCGPQLRHSEANNSFTLDAKAARQPHLGISQAISMPSESVLHASGPLAQQSIIPSAGFTHRGDERANHTLVDQNLSDAQAAIHRLHNQIIDLHTRLNNAERARDQAESRAEVLGFIGPARYIRARELAALVPKAKRIPYEWYPDGRQWLSEVDREV